jgi:hypothetical protein
MEDIAGDTGSENARNVFHRSFGIIIEDETIQGPCTRLLK